MKNNLTNYKLCWRWRSSILVFLFISCFAININAQSTIDSVLSIIAQNNTVIIANTKYWDAQKVLYKTGLGLYDPKADFDFLSGSPAGAGNQIDFTITQAFDFPSVYSKKKQLSNEQITQTDFQLTANRQNVLLEAKLLCIELIYRNKYQKEIDERLQSTQKWLNNFEVRLAKGEGNILDVNKAKLQWIETNAMWQENQSIIKVLNQKLTEMNGGLNLELKDTEYPINMQIPEFAELENTIEKSDPILKYLEQEKVVGEKQVEVSKAMGLPKLETGYHYQSILNQKFHGLHVGASIPIWENKNKVKAQKAELVFTEYNLQNHLNEHYYAILHEYEVFKQLEATLNAYQEAFPSIRSIDLLDKSLAFGEISTLEYFMEVSFFFESLQNYLKTEMEYQKSIAKLNKHLL
jgi:outer membrane protein TolC